MARSQDKDKEGEETVEFQPDFSVEDQPGETKAPEPGAAKAEPRARVPQDTAKATQAVYLLVELLGEMHPTLEQDHAKYGEVKKLLGV